MPNTFSQLYIHHISSVKHRKSLINPHFEQRLFQYISKISKNLNQTLIEINGMPDHIHIAARLRPNMAPSEYVQKVKANSSGWINKEGFLNHKFEWQGGGATYSISRTHVEALRRYIRTQKEHHKKVSFKEEYLHLLEIHLIDFNKIICQSFFKMFIEDFCLSLGSFVRKTDSLAKSFHCPGFDNPGYDLTSVKRTNRIHT